MSEINNNGAENAAEENNINEEILNETVATEETKSEPMTEEDPINKLLDEINELKNKHLRLLADFENYKKRTSKEYYDMRASAGKEVIVSILDTLDNCDRAEAQINNSEDIVLIKEGIQLVFNNLRNTMQSKGLTSFESKGQLFDVMQHEAITEIPAPNPEMVDHVIDEVQKGYMLNDKIIRFAKVVVGK
jgi:molecular chaperone GrpE